MNCFVIIGFGKKPSYANGKVRMLDLDETYTLLIKPVFEALNIECYRAIDKNLTGSIDKLMLEEIRNADIALVDISTLNANVMWELGVRHALRPHHTIMICEKEQMSAIPFDINHFIVHTYTHSEEGIPFKEVERFRAQLTKIVQGIQNLGPDHNDSPVFTFLGRDLSTSDSKMVSSGAGEDAELAMEELAPKESMASLLQRAEDAKKGKDFATALKLFTQARIHAEKNMAFRDQVAFIIQRQALCTYKGGQPTELEAYVNAKNILSELNPAQTSDLEVLGLSGSIEKRLFELTNDERHLESAIQSYERGFTLKQDYYNGINAAFMLYQKALLQKKAGGDWEDTKLKADYIRNEVLKTCLALEADPNFGKRSDAIWILFTIAEAYHCKGNDAQMQAYEMKGGKLAAERADTFAVNSYETQKKKIQEKLPSLR